VLVDELVVEPFFFLCFLVEVLLIVSVLEPVVLDVFCASMVSGASNDKPIATVKNFFIVETSLGICPKHSC
jgi:hypothetical protein